jgi:hypothetical protein
MIRLNSKIEQDFLVDGMRFLTWEHEEFHGIKMCLRVTPAWYGLDVTTYIERDKKGAMERFVSDVQERAAGLKYLKGEAFNISGEFLERGSEGFDEVFLAPENAKAIKRVATLIEEKGADFDNRGLMVVGPPGTGKTLTGRLLLNNSKSTFIWVAARDFARMGAFGGMVHAFEMARELAPSIIFVEDVDNWLDGYTVDMLKSEMDGIRQTKGVVTILTTNYPELLPKALIDRPGRFHDVLKFDLPDDVARKQMLARWLPGLDAVDTIKAVDATAGYSGAHVRELCRFASIIQEQDGLALTAALDAALTKLADQRDLITSVQATGSRYRAASWVSKRFGPQGKSHTEASLMLKHRTLSLCAGDRRATTETKAAISVALADLDEAVQVLKAGRVLSSANEQRIRNATALLDEVLATLQTATEAPAEVIPPATDGPADPLPITMGRALDDNEQVLVLDEEKDIDLAISPDLIRSALKAAISEQLMLVTGRVD